MILKTISQNNTGISSFEQTQTISRELATTGQSFQVSPTSIYRNGSTYLTGMTDENSNHIGFVFKINKFNFEQVEFNSGITPELDGSNHARPSILIDDSGFIWLFQVDPHNAPIKVWCSNVSESILDGFTYKGEINVDFAYQQIYRQSNFDIQILTRTSGTGNSGHTRVVGNLNNLSGFTSQAITDPTGSYRHFTNNFYKYGNITREWFTINVVDTSAPSPRFVYKVGLYYWEISTPNILHNPDNTYTFDISSTPITETLLEANNFYVLGNEIEKSEERNGFAAQVNNEVYFQNAINSRYRIMRIDDNLNKTYSDIIPNSNLTDIIRIDFNGSNLVVQQVQGLKVFIYGLSLDLSKLVYIESYDLLRTRVPLDFPVNFPDVDNFYPIAIRNVLNSDEYNYLTTKDKFFI